MWNDSPDAVRQAVQKHLLQGWLRFTEGNILELLHRLDVENSFDVAVSVLNSLFSVTPLSELVGICKNSDDRYIIKYLNWASTIKIGFPSLYFQISSVPFICPSFLWGMSFPPWYKNSYFSSAIASFVPFHFVVLFLYYMCCENIPKWTFLPHYAYWKHLKFLFFFF